LAITASELLAIIIDVPFFTNVHISLFLHM